MPLQPDRVLDLEDERLEGRAGDRGGPAAAAVHGRASARAHARALFDTSDSDTKDVREITDKLLKATEVGGSGGGRPPTITFGWGKTVSFSAVARQLTIRYTLFRPDGSPVRALAHISLMQSEKAQDASAEPGGTPGGGNPTTRGIDAISSHVVRDGDSLPSIAFAAYGDPTLWRDDRGGKRDRRPLAPAARPLAGDSEARAVSRVDTGVMLALVEVKISRVPVREDLIQEVPVQDSLALPSTFSITFAPRDLGRGVDPLGVEGVDPSIGAEVDVYLGAPRDTQKQELIRGEITALEPNYGPDGIRLVATGYDRSHRLHLNRKTRTFQQMTASQIVSKVTSEVKVRQTSKRPRRSTSSSSRTTRPTGS